MSCINVINLCYSYFFVTFLEGFHLVFPLSPGSSPDGGGHKPLPQQKFAERHPSLAWRQQVPFGQRYQPFQLGAVLFRGHRAADETLGGPGLHVLHVRHRLPELPHRQERLQERPGVAVLRRGPGNGGACSVHAGQRLSQALPREHLGDNLNCLQGTQIAIVWPNCMF